MTAAMPHRCWPEGFPHPRQGDPRPSLLPHTPRPAIFKPSCPPSCPPGTPVTPPRPSQHTCLCGLRLPSSVLHPGSRTWDGFGSRLSLISPQPRVLSETQGTSFWLLQASVLEGPSGPSTIRHVTFPTRSVLLKSSSTPFLETWQTDFGTVSEIRSRTPGNSASASCPG